MAATTEVKEPVTTKVPERDGKAITGEDKQADIASIAREEENRRDMLDKITEIDASEMAEIEFADTSPPRPRTILYATLDGEPLPVTRKRARNLIKLKLPDGRRMFIAPNADGSKPAHLPEYRLGSVKCFMHRESEEREVLNSLGMAGKECPAGHLANLYAKVFHEGSCHKRERKIYQGWLDDKKEAEAIERQEKQYTATMAMAQAVADTRAPVAAPVATSTRTCDSCGVAIEGRLADHNCQES